MALGKFDTDSEALRRRIESYDRFGAAALNAWIFNHLSPAVGQRGHHTTKHGVDVWGEALVSASSSSIRS